MKNGCGHQERDRSTALMRASTSISANRYAHGIINPDSLTRRSSPPFDLGKTGVLQPRTVKIAIVLAIVLSLGVLIGRLLPF
jgi:hypothetical protein